MVLSSFPFATAGAWLPGDGLSQQLIDGIESFACETAPGSALSLSPPRPRICLPGYFGEQARCMFLAAAEAGSASVKAAVPSARRAHDTFTLLLAGPERRFGISRISGRDALSPYSRVGVIGLLRRLSAQLWFRAVFMTSFSGGGQCLLSASVSYAARRG